MTPDFKGDDKGFKQFFQTYYYRLCLFAQQYVSNSQAAEDIVIKIFFNFWQNGLHTEKGVKALLYVSVRNRCINYLRDKKREEGYLMKYAETEDEWDNESWGNYLKTETAINTLDRGIELLPGKCKKVMQLILEGYSTKEIAAKLEIKVSTVRNQKKNGIKLLRKWAASNNLALMLVLLMLLEQQPEKFFKISQNHLDVLNSSGVLIRES